METRNAINMKKIFATNSNDTATFIIRVTLALVILPHGLQKLFGAFGGFGFDNTMTYFTETVGIPWVLGVLVILIESVGMMLLLAGFLTRPIALALIAIMIGAALQHIQNGFFMNWFNNQSGEGVEFFLIAIALSINSVMKGAGKLSVDNLIFIRLSRYNPGHGNIISDTPGF